MRIKVSVEVVFLKTRANNYKLPPYAKMLYVNLRKAGFFCFNALKKIEYIDIKQCRNYN